MSGGLNVKIPHYLRRSFEVHTADETWRSGEIILRSELDRNAIWTHLQTLTPLPDISQFQFVSGRSSISHIQQWTVGLIVAIPHTLPVT
jgi:hypothetical protein